MKLNKISLKDKRVFVKYLNLKRHELSSYAFENIYIWRGLFDISWAVIENSLCLFFKDKIGCFLYLSPLGRDKHPAVIKEVFRVMEAVNDGGEVSRIENVEEEDLVFYSGLGLNTAFKSYDYLCGKRDLEELKGNKFKSKRSCVNYFVKNYSYRYLPFLPKYRKECIGLFGAWMRQRKEGARDSLYLGMLEDSLKAFKVLLSSYRDLGITGRVVKVGNELKALTFGFKLNNDTFCILYEVTDLSTRGAAQFIFQRFSSELQDYRYINIMDDSGLDNLKKVKLSYQPVRLIPAYIVKR